MKAYTYFMNGNTAFIGGEICYNSFEDAIRTSKNGKVWGICFSKSGSFKFRIR